MNRICTRAPLSCKRRGVSGWFGRQNWTRGGIWLVFFPRLPDPAGTQVEEEEDDDVDDDQEHRD